MSPQLLLRAIRGRAVFLALCLAVLLGQKSGQAISAPVTLPFSNGFLLTGNYVVGSVDLPQTSDGHGFVTGTISMTGANRVPAGAEIVSAFLFWETITSQIPAQPQTQLAGVQFRDHEVDAVNIANAALTGNLASCWSNAGYTLNTMRADVRRLLPVDPTGRRIVNDDELIANHYPLNTVRLPETGAGNLAPQSAGASLVVIYRSLAEPLTKVVIYDGIAPLQEGGTFSLNIRGLYKSALAPSAKLTYLAASGQKNATDRLFFGRPDVSPLPLVGTNLFDGNTPPSDRAWQSVTADMSARMPGADLLDGYGETVSTGVDHGGAGANDCLTIQAVIFSAALKDDDHDGIPDGVEDGIATKDADGSPLPSFPASVSSSHKDILVEMDAMQAAPETSYGSLSAPYNSKKCIVGGDMSECTVTDHVGHSHLPTPASVKILIDAYKNAPITNIGWTGADGSSGIYPHFDVGDPASYISALGSDYAPYFFPAGQARGGNLVPEQAFPCLSDVPCQFTAFPGTVGWMGGFLGYAHDLFDRSREGLVHWVFYVHARGLPKSPNRCLDPATGTNPDGTCNVVNRDYYVPASQSGVAQLPGGKAMISLGMWDKVNFVGSDDFIALTTLHELGHNVNLYHGGLPPQRTAASIYYEPNCKPNYLSIMNYSFVANGLRDDLGVGHADYSRETYSNVNEELLSDGTPASPLRFHTAWYVPFDSPLAVALGASTAKRFCSGASFPNPLPAGWKDMARVEALQTADTIDWNGDGFISATAPQDVNFDGALTGGATLRGFNDWNNLRLDQIGGATNALGLSQGALRLGGSILLQDGSIVLQDGSIVLQDGSIILQDGSIQLQDGSIVLQDGSIVLQDGSIVLQDGSIQLQDGSIVLQDGSIVLQDGSIVLQDGSIVLQDGSIKKNEDVQEQTTEQFVATQGGSSAAPLELTGCVIGANCAQGPSVPLDRTRLQWKKPTVVNVAGGANFVGYLVFRVKGHGLLNGNTVFQLTGTPIPGTNFVDVETPNGIEFTYYVKAAFDDGTASGASNLVFVTSMNAAPKADGNRYSTPQGTTLNVAAPGLLANDTDTDSPAASIKAVAFTGPSMAGGQVALNADGSFTYTPPSSFTGVDSFTSKANDGEWTKDLPAVAMSPDSNAATVTITVTRGAAYGFTGFLSPMAAVAATDPSTASASFAGTFQLGRVIPLKWKVTLNGTAITSLASLDSVEAVQRSASCTAIANPMVVPIYPNGSSAGTFKWDARQFLLNWDTSTITTKTCYRIRLKLKDSGPIRVTDLQFK